MEEYPEELRTPPVSLISLVGCPEIHQMMSAYLHSEQPPINTLALPDFSKISLMAKKHKDSGADGPPSGIIKRDWLIKHRTKIPAVVAALFSSDHVSGGPTEWLQLCTHLDELKSVVHARNIKLVVVIVQASSKVISTVATSRRSDRPLPPCPSGQDIVMSPSNLPQTFAHCYERDKLYNIIEDRMIALRKRAEVDLKHIISFCLDDESGLKQSLKRLCSTFAELASMYYGEEGRRVKTRLEKKNFNSIELAIRYCFKVAVYAEFRRDWVEALKFYEDAYHAIREMVGTSTRLPAIQRLVEIKAVAEQVHFKLSTLLLHGGKIIEAVLWFHQHLRYYKKLVGSPDVTFLHWEWMSRQFLVFAELLETSSKTVPGFPLLLSAAIDKALTEWELQPAYYYQLASHYLKEKRAYLDISISLLDPAEDVEAMVESVVPSAYVGQCAHLLEQKGDVIVMQPLTDDEFTRYAVTEAKRFQDSFEIIALLKKSFDLYSSLKAVRMASYCAFNMAKEYCSTGDTKKSKEFLDSAISFYRHEGWVALLWEALGLLRECSRRDGSLKEFVEYSLEMAALPISSGERINSPYKDVGPAGPPSFEQREMILKDILSLVESSSSSGQSDSNFRITENAPLQLEIDLVSPLRAALLISVAFHEQTVKPGTPAVFTLSLLSQLPVDLEIDELEIQFNQSDCNIILNADKSPSPRHLDGQLGCRSETASALKLTPNKWLRLTFDVTSEKSGKLDCISIIARIASHLTICCRAESPASLEDLPFWKFEERMEYLPTKDPILAFSGQKAIQVDEPEPLVDLSVTTSGPALVGETFIIPVSITTKGHAVHSGELKINLVDTKGGGLVSPREIDSHSTEGHHVELIRVSIVDAENKSLVDAENSEKIQHTFGLIPVPLLNSDGDSWSCRLEIRWHRPIPVMLFVSLGYSPNSGDASLQQVHIHKSMEIEGRLPFYVTHKFMPPIRRDPLLLSRTKPASDPHGLPSLPKNETSVLVVSVKNCSGVPLRLLSLSTTQNDPEHSCTVYPTSDNDPAMSDLLVADEEYKKLFSVIPVGNSSSIKLGTLCLTWKRDSGSFDQVLTKHELPEANVESTPLALTLQCPPHAILGHPFTFFIKIQNQTELLQEIKFSVVDSPGFLSTGSHGDTVFVLPRSDQTLSYKLVPLSSGPQLLPRVTVTAARYSVAYQPSNAASTIFVFPASPQFMVETATDKLAPVILAE